MDVYRLLKLWSGKMPGFVKIAGLWGMHLFRRRLIGIYIDPVLACNLRCRMCYFSDPAKRAEMHGRMTSGQLDAVGAALFHRALKLQIGCGAEPTLYPQLEELVARGKQAGIPYISLTTNGMLLVSGKTGLAGLVRAGLSEITLSMHGTSREIYEELMPGADFTRLLALIGEIAEVKRSDPSFRVRVNFTVNSLNKEDLRDNRFLGLWPQGCLPDVVQLRPVQKLGESSWTDFDPAPLIDDYDATIGNVVERCRALGIICLAPSRDNIAALGSEQDSRSALVEDLSYCYVSPGSCYKDDFELGRDTYESFHKRHHTAWRLFKAIFVSGSGRRRNTSKKLNYTVK